MFAMESESVISDTNRLPFQDCGGCSDQYHLDCGDEDLSDVQNDFYSKNRDALEFARTLLSAQTSMSKTGPVNIENTASIPMPPLQPTSQPLILPSGNGLQNGGYILIDPNNLKLVVSSHSNNTSVVNTTSRANSNQKSSMVSPIVISSFSTAKVPPPTSSFVIQSPANKAINSQNAPYAKPTTTVAPTSGKSPSNNIQEGNPVKIVLQAPDNEQMEIAPEEVAQLIPGYSSTTSSNKTFPSLCVLARPHLFNGRANHQVACNERLGLDNKMRKILQMSPCMFTEHLLQQRLIKCEQFCSKHPGNKLKLGMYSDSTKFPFSGGYVWIAACCGGSFTSVFRGSIFESGHHPPTVIIKLLYHWACQTSTSNVLQWVKVDENFLKTFYMILRAVCTAAVHEKHCMMGGLSKTVEVGVISLGIGTGSSREVKVDILGALDLSSKQLRLHAIDHKVNAASGGYTKKFEKIVLILKKWIDPSSRIVTDFPIDHAVCIAHGFTNVRRCCTPALNNSKIMGYLRVSIPRMFQNTLNLLPRHTVQQFLDELTWREMYGATPSQAYISLVDSIADQTKISLSTHLCEMYKLIACNPHRDWRYSRWAEMNRKYKGTRTPQAPWPSTFNSPPVPVSQPPAKTSPPQAAVKMDDHSRSEEPGSSNYPVHAQIALEPYYYGELPGDISLQKPSGLMIVTECIVCREDLYTSTTFTEHLIRHSLNSVQHKEYARSICRFCMKPTLMLESHIKEYHESLAQRKYACKICYKSYVDEKTLVNHMIYTHCELDMPYLCEMCGYRTSVYTDIITHFNKQHKKSACAQCPYCLKIVRFASVRDEEIPNNQIYFMQHVQKHVLNKGNRKCEKCMLTFCNLSTLKHHQENHHSSVRDSKDQINRYDINPNDFILMAAPLDDPPLPLSLQRESFPKINGVALKNLVSLDSSFHKYLCAECDGPLTSEHFSVLMTCSKCKYRSCCVNAIKDHSNVVHNNPSTERLPVINSYIKMEKPLFCSGCSFSTYWGNKMASHLLLCPSGEPIALGSKRKARTLSFEVESAKKAERVASDSEPEAVAEPETASEPESSAEPETAAERESSAEPETAAERESSAEPEVAVESEPSAEPEPQPGPSTSDEVS